MPDSVRNTDWFARRVIYRHDHGMRFRGEFAGRTADNRVLHAHAGIADGRNAGADQYRIGIVQRPAVVARLAGEDGPETLRRYLRIKSDALKIFHPRGFAPAQIGDIIHVVESIVVGP